MTIDEAIGILAVEIKKRYPPRLFRSEKNAIRLGIEALKEIKAARGYSVGLIPDKLPSETDQ